MEAFTVHTFIPQTLNTVLRMQTAVFCNRVWLPAGSKAAGKARLGGGGQDPAFSGLLCPSDSLLRQVLRDLKPSQLR